MAFSPGVYREHDTRDILLVIIMLSVVGELMSSHNISFKKHTLHLPRELIIDWCIFPQPEISHRNLSGAFARRISHIYIFSL